MIWYRFNRDKHQFKMIDLIESFGMSKQNFYSRFSRMNYVFEEHQELIRLVHRIRENHPNMSARIMYTMIKPSTIGRDKFEKLCFENKLGVKRRKNFRVTTNSYGVTRFPNKIKEIKVTAVNQVLVSDITYYEMNGRFYFLTFIMDLFNREIVGYSTSNNLRSENTTIPALQKVKQLRGSANLKGAIIHSDAGGQYYSKAFKEITNDLKMINSMTEGSVYENAHAERLNGIIKNDYLYLYNPDNINALRNSVRKAVWMYNNEKPHYALNGLSPINFATNTIENQNNSSSYRRLSTVQ